MNLNVYNLKDEKVSTLEVPDSVFATKWNPTLVHQIVLAQLANKRTPVAHAKDRSEVSGGGRKPWRQKGTGRARHGSNRSPLWSGGGKAHGPSKDRDYSQKVNKKMKRLAINSVLSKKLKDQEVKIFDHFEFDVPKTKTVSKTLKALLGLSKNSKKYDVLLIPGLENKNIVRISRNLTKVKILGANSLNAYDLLNYKQIFIEEPAIEVINRYYSLKK